MSRHSFDPQIAAEVGLNAAVIYQNIVFWIEKNEANDRHFKDGRTWTYNSITAFAKLFPYFTEKQIRTAIDKLLDAGLILKGNYSDNTYDRTNWYALGDPICPPGQMDMPDRDTPSAPEGGGSAPEGKSIRNRYKPDRNPPPTRPEAREVAAAEVERVWSAYPADRQRDREGCAALIAAALAEVSAAELTAAVQAYAAETAGYTRSKVSFSDNWLREGRWRRYVDEGRRRQGDAGAAVEKGLHQVAGWVKARHGMCQHVTVAQVSAAIKRGLITRQDAKAAGVMR